MRSNSLMRVVPAMFLCVSLGWACGPPQAPPPSPGKLVGESCAQTGDCQDGLLCQEGSCAYARCTTALNPEAYCAQRLELPTSRVVCDAQGECRERTGGLDDPCELDSACDFGLICEGSRCVETCLSHASCFKAQTACLARDADPKVRFCRVAVDLALGQACDEDGHCAQALICEQGRCTSSCEPDTAPCPAPQRCLVRQEQEGWGCL